MRWLQPVRQFLRDRLPVKRWLARWRPSAAPTTAAIERLDEQLISGLASRRVPTWQQLKFLPRVLKSHERLQAAALLLVFLTATVLLLLRLVGRFTQAIPIPGGSYVEGVVGAPQYLNPVLAAGADADDDLNQLIFTGLFRYDTDHAVVPDLAEAFTINPEGTVYTIRLKPDLKWSDGEPLTINDVLFTFTLIQDERFKSPLFGAFRSVTVERVDDRTISFTLKQSIAPFLSSLTVGILPEHRWQDIQPSTVRLNKLNLEPVGAGPHRVKEFHYDANGNVRLYELEPNPYYQGSVPRIKRLTIRFYPDSSTALEALRSHKVEGVSVLNPDVLPAVEGTQTKILKLRLPRYTAIFFNQKRANLKSRELREALGLALNRLAIAREATNGTASISDGPLPLGFPGSSQPEAGRPYDPKRAEELLDNTGWKRGDDGVRRKGEEELTVSLTTSDRFDYTRAGEAIINAWKAIGVKAELNVVPAQRINREVIRPRDYDAILFSQVIGADPDPFPFWHSSQERDSGLNLAIFFRKETDKLLEEARTIQSLEERTRKYAEFQKILNEEIAAIFLWQPSYLYPLPKKIKGFTQDSLIDPADRFSDIGNWYIKTKRRFR